MAGKQSKQTQDFPIVAVGASAGGIEAFTILHQEMAREGWLAPCEELTTLNEELCGSTPLPSDR